MSQDKTTPKISAFGGNFWIDTPEQGGYYWLLYDNRNKLDIALVYKTAPSDELQAIVLSNNSNPSYGYKPPFPITCTSLANAKWLSIVEPNKEEMQMLKNDLEKELKSQRLTELASEMERLKKELAG